jgi:hypothetical protein
VYVEVKVDVIFILNCPLSPPSEFSSLHQYHLQEAYIKKHPVVSEHFFILSAPESNSVATAVGQRTQDTWLPGRHSAL